MGRFSNELGSVKKEISTLERLQSLQPAASKETKSFKPSVSFSKKNVDTNEAFKGWALAQVNRKEHITNTMMEHAQAGKVSFDEPITASVKWNQVKGTDANGGFAVNEAVVAGIVHKMKDFGGMLQTSHVFNTSMEHL